MDDQLSIDATECRTADQPLFQEPPEELTEDWTWGFLVGGMVSSDVLIARSYRYAADRLVEDSLAGSVAEEVGYPVLFLYRHAVELYLKVIVQPQHRNHSISGLLPALEQVCRDRYGQTLPRWVRARLEELDGFDPGAFAFRYARDRNGDFSIETEWWIELRHLARVVGAILSAFEKMAGP